MPFTTMRNVAQYAGVSTATVSRALTHPDRVSGQTRQKVEQAILQTGYRFSSSILPIKNPESHRILVIMTQLCQLFFAEIIRGIKEAAEEQGYLLLFIDGEKQKQFINQFISALRPQCDGMIFFDSPLLPNEGLEVGKNLLPATAISSQCHRQADFPVVQIDNLAAAFQAVNYLLELGHRRIASMGGPRQLAASEYRKQGYLQALQRHGIALEKRYLVDGDFTYSSGAECLDTLMSLSQPPSAIFCHSDVLAIGALSRAKKRGLKIPQELSLIGCDAIAQSEYSDPPLTTVAQPGYQIGRQAILLLVGTLRGNRLKDEYLLPESEIIVRETTAPPMAIRTT